MPHRSPRVIPANGPRVNGCEVCAHLINRHTSSGCMLCACGVTYLAAGHAPSIRKTLNRSLFENLPVHAGSEPQVLTLYKRHRLLAATTGVRDVTASFQPSLELDMAIVKLMEAELWLSRAPAIRLADEPDLGGS